MSSILCINKVEIVKTKVFGKGTKYLGGAVAWLWVLK